MWFLGAPVTFHEDPVRTVPADLQVRPTRPADRHVTLLFLGRVPDDAVQNLWGSLPSLGLPDRAGAVGWERFGRRALALALADADERWRTAAGVAAAIASEQLPDLAVPVDFRPHVTLGRLPKAGRPPTPHAMRRWPVPATPLVVGPPTLFRSRDDPTGDRYEVVAQQPTS